MKFPLLFQRSLNVGLFDPMCSSSSSLTSDRMVKEKSSTSMSDLEDSTASTDSPSDPGKAAAAASKTNNSQSSSPRQQPQQPQQQQQQQQQQQMPDSFRNNCEQHSSSVLHEDEAEAKLRLGKINLQKYFSGEPASTSSDAEKPDRVNIFAFTYRWRHQVQVTSSYTSDVIKYKWNHHPNYVFIRIIGLFNI